MALIDINTLKISKHMVPESVVIAVVGGLELDVDEVDGEVGATDVNALHCRVVQRDEVGEQVQVSASDRINKYI